MRIQPSSIFLKKSTGTGTPRAHFAGLSSALLAVSAQCVPLGRRRYCDIVPVCPAGPPTFAFAFFCLVHRSSGCVFLPAVALSVSVGESERGRTPFRLRLRPSFLSPRPGLPPLFCPAPLYIQHTFISWLCRRFFLHSFADVADHFRSVARPLRLSLSVDVCTCVPRRPTYPIPVFPSLHAFHPRACSLFAALFAGSLAMILPNQ